MTAQLVDDLTGGMSVLLTGMPRSGRSHLARLVAAELGRLRTHVVFVRGNRMLAEQPLAALSLVNGGMNIGQKASAGSVLHQAANAFGALFERSDSVLIVDDVAELDRASVGVIMDTRAKRKIPMLLVGGPGIYQDELLTALVASAQPGVSVAMNGMSFEDITQMINALLVGVVGPETISQIATLSGGLPGLVQTIVAVGLRNGRLVRRQGVWTTTGDLWDPALVFSLLPFISGLDPDDIDSLSRLANAGDMTRSEANDMVGASQVNKLARQGLLRLDPPSAIAGAHVFPVALAELLRRGDEIAAPVAEHDLMSAIDLGRWPVRLTGLEAAAIANRIRANWRADVHRLWAQWNGERTVSMAVPLLQALFSGGADDERISVILEKSTSDGDEEACAEFAVLEASYRAVWQHDLAGACAHLKRSEVECPELSPYLRGQLAHLVFLCDRVPDAAALEMRADDARAPGLLLMARAESMIAQGRIDDAAEQLAQLDPRQEWMAVIKRTLEALALVLGDDPAAGVALAIKYLWNSVVTLDAHSIPGYAYVASLGMCMLGRFDELKSIVEIVYRMSDTNIFQSRFKTGLFMLGSFVAGWEGRSDYARNLASQANAMNVGIGPFPAMFDNRELLVSTTSTSDHMWDEIDDLLDRGFLTAAVYLAVAAIEVDLKGDRAEPIIRQGLDSQSRVLRALARYVATVAARDMAAYPAMVSDLRNSCGPLDVTRATVTWALLLREQGDIDGWLEQAEAAWRESGLIGRSVDGLLSRLVEAVDLTEREAEVVRRTAEGMPSAEIASQMGLAVRTIETHLHSAYRKSGVNSRDGLRNLARTWLALGTDD